MERFFRRLKTEWIPTVDYHTFGEAKTSIIGYYSQIRPHRHNKYLAPNVTEGKYWIEYKTVTKFT